MWSEEDLRIVLYSVIQYRKKDNDDYDMLSKRLADIIGKSSKQIKNLIIVSNYDTMTLEELEEEYKIYDEVEESMEYEVGDRITVQYIHGSIKHRATGTVAEEHPYFYMIEMDGGYKTCVNK